MNRIYTRLLAVLLAFAIFSSPVTAVNVTEPSARTETLPDATAVNSAVKEFRNLSKKEKRDRLKQVKKLVKEHKAAKKAQEPSDNTILLAILAILLPPLAVYLHEGTTNNRFWISVLLTLLFWVPGVIYALIVVLG